MVFIHSFETVLTILLLVWVFHQTNEEIKLEKNMGELTWQRKIRENVFKSECISVNRNLGKGC